MRIGARRRVPTILQQEAVECGAACLAMVLAHHGRWVPLEELRESCDVNRDGTKASNLVKAARRLGMVAKGLKRDVDGLAALAMPAVVFWNFNHFIVVEGFAADGVWINDPNSGPRKMLRSEFSDGFTGVVLAFEPGPEFRKAGGREPLRRIVGRRLFEFRMPIAAAVLAGVFLIVPGIVAAGFGRIFVDGIIVGGNERWLEPLLVAMLVVGLLRGALQFTQLVTLLRTQVGMSMTLAARQMWQILHLPLTFFTQRYAGDIAYRFQLVDRFTTAVTVSLIPALIGILSIAGYGAILFVLDPLLGSIVAAASLTAVVVLALSARGLENTNRRLVGAQAQVQSLTVQAVAMADEFRASGTEDLLVARWSAAQAKVVSAEQSAMMRSTLLTQFATLVVALGGAAVLVVGGLRVMDGAVTIGILLAFQLMMGNFTAPVLALVGVGTQMQQLRGLSERLDDIARYDHGAIRMRAGKSTRSAGTGATDLVLRDVSFGYRQLEPPFIEGLTLHVPPGARVGLVGGSGSGKSTIGRLMVGLVEPTAGTVTLGGIPIADWDTPRLRRTVAYVDQSVGLIEGTIRNAISVWDKTLSEERIVAAAQDAGAHDFIMRRPAGYASLLTEGGGNLSGGERQRLALARALAVDPAILVLDEATSALDPVVELSIMDALRRRGCACVIIAHRLSTIRDCDLIVVLRNGVVIESGTHGELMALDGEYRGLVEH